MFSPEAALRQVLTLLQTTTPGNAAEEVGSWTGEGRASRGRVFSELSLRVLEDPLDPQGRFPLANTASCHCRGDQRQPVPVSQGCFVGAPEFTTQAVSPH